MRQVVLELRRWYDVDVRLGSAAFEERRVTVGFGRAPVGEVLDFLARALDAKIDLDFNPDGLHCHITIPANQLLAAR